MSRRVSILLLAVPLALGCNRADNAADRQAAEMREQITKLEAESDRIDQRLGSIEVEMTEERQAKADAPPPTTTTPAAPLPPPRVVQLGGTPEVVNDDPNAPDARPEIRLVGSAGSARNARGRSRADDDASPPPMRSPALDPEAKKAYEQGLALVQGKQYAKGNDQLAAFLVKWPDHPFAENATYWRGEAFFAQGEYLRAAEQFDAVLSRFGAGNKAPDALLKLGMCHDRLGASDRAAQYWDRLKSEFPRSDAVKRIPSVSKSDRSRPVKGPRESR
jgi:tol-pal system protein YbgF